MQVNRYQRTDTVFLAEVTCLWYGSFHTQQVRLILLRDDATDTGYDLALISTDPTTPTAELVSRYAWRCSIEVTFAEARDLLGVGRPRAAPAARSNGPSPSACTATRSPSSGTRSTATTPPTPPSGANASPGTPPRPTRHSPT
ncbi:hypothetical protein [Streptomyces sp. NPDC048142]|uniref:hypothetical protein n=1 Tax=Streptomyces sp. NPDC048142 TaxID=3365501 RepID=UPI00371467CD